MSVKKLTKNIILYGLSNGLKSLVPFIMLPILTSYISASGYGILSLIETTILFLAPFILLNVPAGISVEYYKVEKKELSIYIANGMYISTISFVFFFILFFFAKNVISEILSIPAELIFLLPILVILRLIPAIVLVIFQAQQRAVKYLNFSIFQTILDFMLSAGFVIFYKYGYLGRLSGIYIAFFVFSIIGILYLFRMKYIDFIFSKKIVKEILKFGVPLIPHVIGGTVIMMSGRYFISYFKDNSFVGLFTVAYQIAALVLLFSRSVNQAWSPMLFSLLKNKEFDMVKKITKILFGVFVLASLVIYLISDFLFATLIDKSYSTSIIYYPYLLLGFFFQSIYFLIANFFFYLKKTGLLAIITFTGAFINIVLNYFFIKNFNVIGITYSFAITWLFFLFSVLLIFKFKIYKYVFEIV